MEHVQCSISCPPGKQKAGGGHLQNCGVAPGINEKWLNVAKFKKRVTWPWPRPMGAVCHPKLAFDIFYLRTKFDDSLASAVPEIWLRVSISTSSSAVTDEPERRTASQQMAKFYNSHVTTTTPLLWVICHPVARIDIAYLCFVCNLTTLGIT